MTSDYYFKKWKNTLKDLNTLIKLDLEYQDTKAHDKKSCEAVQRLTGILGKYISCYNEAVVCLHQNLQVQKTELIRCIVKALVARILEIKHQLRKLEGSHFHFLINGLIEHKLTSYDAEFSEIPFKYERAKHITDAINEALQKSKEVREPISEEEELLEIDDVVEKDNWWEVKEENVDKEHKGINITAIYEVEEKNSEETLRKKEKVALIQAHEKLRQITEATLRQRQKTEKWEKELQGILNLPATIELREKSAKMIQNIVRLFFKLKRQKLESCKLDELLGVRVCENPSFNQSRIDLEASQRHSVLYKKYTEQWKYDCKVFKDHFKKRRCDEIAEDYRDYIREWFLQWYIEAKIFLDLPQENNGGLALIFKEEVITPSEWQAEYESYLENKKARKNKTAYQLKYEKIKEKDAEMLLKKQELIKKKQETDLLKKMQKNPTLHPGYHYPASKKIENLIKSMEDYCKKWSDLDMLDTNDVKEKYKKDIDKENLCMEAQMEIYNYIEPDMRNELVILRNALKAEYDKNEEKLPENFIPKSTRKKQRCQVKKKIMDDVGDKLTDLAVKKILKEYPRTKFEDFVGDVNFTGNDLRCTLKAALPFGGEIRSAWWELCREVGQGYKRILLVGPSGSGKTTLVHIMATVNDAVLYELDPSSIEEGNQTLEYLQELVNNVVECVKMTQPSIIVIKHIHKLYYSKVPIEEAYMNYDVMKRLLIRKLFKKIHKHDNVTIIGTCINPWLTKSMQMLKKFPNVLLMPDTNYSTVHLILQNWVKKNRIVPSDMDIQSLAYMLQGYSFGFLIKALDEFLSAERIIKIAANGLRPQDIYDFILEKGNETNDYSKYLKWYTEKTHWGKKEGKHLEEQKEFQLLVDQWAEKMKKKKKQK